MLLAPDLVERQAAGRCRVGSKHRAEFEELDVLDALEVLVFSGVEEEVVLVSIARVVVVVLGGSANTMVVLIDTPTGSADKVGKAKEYSPEGSG